MRTLITTSTLATMLLATSALAASSQLDADTNTLTIKLATTGTDHTTKTGAIVHDTIHGTLANGDKFTARIYTPSAKKPTKDGITPCTTDTDCEAKNPHIK